ncbi:MAG: GGDEF domain-containing protein [Chloroflexi bacterium]|nr:GGDEF domain-containing protein [Chloroflexota bacterium]
MGRQEPVTPTELGRMPADHRAGAPAPEPVTRSPAVCFLVRGIAALALAGTMLHGLEQATSLRDAALGIFGWFLANVGSVAVGVLLVVGAQKVVATRRSVLPPTAGALALTYGGYALAGAVAGGVRLAIAELLDVSRTGTFPWDLFSSAGAGVVVYLLMGVLAHQYAAYREGLRMMSYLAARDGLTGLLNHREFHLRLRQELARAQRAGTPVSLVLLDLDDFKVINDRYGHQQGDRVLAEVATVLQQEVRRSDISARYGGEEFALILPGIPQHAAGSVAERVRVALADLRIALAPQHPIRLTTSVGVASYPEDGQDADALLAAADRALYAAKRGGKNRIVVGDDHVIHEEQAP